jgi:SSS family solute:Na+ symporter
MHDFIANRFPRIKSDQGRVLLYSRLVTALWGVFCITSGYAIAESSRTVIELVNMIGSAFYGPILAVFLLGAFTRSIGGSAAILGLAAGLTANLLTALFLPGVSWLWWNPLGCLVALSVAFASQLLLPLNSAGRALWTLRSVLSTRPLERAWLLDARTWVLLAAFAAIIAVTALLGS